MEPKTYRYASRRPNDAGMRARLRDLANERPRFGYRQLHILLKRENVALNHKTLFRFYREERLTVRRKDGIPAPSRQDARHARDQQPKPNAPMEASRVVKPNVSVSRCLK